MPTRCSGFFVQSTHGTKGNFEVVVPREGGGMALLFRNNDAPPTYPWYGPFLAFGSTNDLEATTLLQSKQGALEAVVWEGTSLVHYSRDDGGTWEWKQPTVLPGGATVSGSPAFIQSTHGSQGNFEVVAPVAGGGIAHWWRQNDHPDKPWHGPVVIGQGNVAAVAMAQTNYGPAGNVELVARLGNTLVHYYRDDGNTWGWHGPFAVGTGVKGGHAFIQSTLGTKGHFEVVAPATGGGLMHLRRDNDNPVLPWVGPVVFGSGDVEGVGLIQSNFGAQGNLEIVVRGPAGLAQYFRDDSGTWHGPFAFGAAPTAPPTTHGECAIPYEAEVVAVHTAVLHTGKVLLFSFADDSDQIGESRVLEPTSGTLQTPTGTPHAFCSGHVFLGDGKLFVAGGHHHDITSLHTFDPDGSQPSWTMAGMMDEGRWYPTCTTLADGKVLVISGTKGEGGPVGPHSPINNTLQVFDPGSGIGMAHALDSPFSSHFPASFPTIDLYPFVYLLPSGVVLVHSRNTTRFFNPASNTWAATQLRTVLPTSRTYPVAGTSVLLPLLPASVPAYRARVLVVGGSSADPESAHGGTPATNTVELLDLGEASPAWRFSQPMTEARVMPDAVLLPDGTVAVVSGSSTGKADSATDPVLPIELFNPASETWTTMCSMKVPRLYHSTALLLPDARVLIAGKDGLFNAHPYKYAEHRIEIFSPPYLFHGARPAISSAPAAVTYGQTFNVDTPQAGSIASVVLVRPGSVTHSFNMDQRLVGLQIVGHSASAVAVQAPPDGRIAPPGFYMLFILDTAHVPSIAKFLRVG